MSLFILNYICSHSALFPRLESNTVASGNLVRKVVAPTSSPCLTLNQTEVRGVQLQNRQFSQEPR